MAFWVVGGGSPLPADVPSQTGYIDGGGGRHRVASNYDRGFHDGGFHDREFVDQDRVFHDREFVDRDHVFRDRAFVDQDHGFHDREFVDRGIERGFDNVGFSKQARFDDWGDQQGDYANASVGDDRSYYNHAHRDADRYPVPARLGQGPVRVPTPMGDSIPVRNLAFLVIRERSPTPEPSPSPSPPAPVAGPHLRPGPTPCQMERTESGLSISSETVHSHHSYHSPRHPDESDLIGDLIGDLDAARMVRDHATSFRRRWPDSQHSRILKALINPKSRGADFPLDNDALRSIFSAANELFFANRLAQRVRWDWSHQASAQYQSHIVGTTALRRSASLGGYETLIVLSSPILKDTQYNRRLLISTFLHEMIHSFLFVTCGLKARECGGHTEGFRQIAEVIDEWVGKEHLRLRDMEADLERFRGGDMAPPNEPMAANLRGPYAEEWRQHAERVQRGDYLPEPQPQRHRDDQRGWQWHEQEGFWARSANPAGPTYVY